MMTSNVSIRLHRPQRIGVGTRQRVASKPLTGNLKTLCKPLAMVSAASILFALVVTQFLQFQVDTTNLRREQLQAEGLRAGNANVQLLAQRAQLTSKQHVLAVAGEKFGLQAPEKGQVHRM